MEDLEVPPPPTYNILGNVQISIVWGTSSCQTGRKGGDITSDESSLRSDVKASATLSHPRFQPQRVPTDQRGVCVATPALIPAVLVTSDN